MPNPDILEATINQLAIMLTSTAPSNSVPSCKAHVLHVCTSKKLNLYGTAEFNLLEVDGKLLPQTLKLSPQFFSQLQYKLMA